ncbi:ABC transporter permease [Dyella tabacisoli]|uniref:ABC transporter permease n=1 Tax=Dyella tabacisoli TaxID=2282381 RepID=A0A369USJ9_9GAMM|nr:ABC transporter permease [Dyella tabacisoli]RDD81309.1 ABC transporter permease [Dyella tabacisoli]
MYSVALKMLTGDRLKYFGLIAGIAFAAMLIVQQASILVGLTRQTGAFIRDTAQADLWVMDPQVRFSQDQVPLRSTVLQRVRGTDGVDWAVPLYQGFNRGHMPDGTSFTLILVGIDDATMIGAPPQMELGKFADLRRDKAIFIDGDTAATKLMMKRGGGRAIRLGDRFTINDQEVVATGAYRGRESFFWEPVIYTTYSRALTLSSSDHNTMSFVLVKIRPGQDIRAVQKNLVDRTGLKVLTNDQFIDVTADYILKATGILVNFGLAVILGVVIGSLVAGQTFYNFTLDNLRHYGALKAMGVSDGTLARMVWLQAGTVAVLGYGIGVGMGSIIGWGLRAGGLAFSMPWQIPAFAFASIISVCALAAWLSLRRVFKLEPAVVFRG